MNFKPYIEMYIKEGVMIRANLTKEQASRIHDIVLSMPVWSFGKVELTPRRKVKPSLDKKSKK